MSLFTHPSVISTCMADFPIQYVEHQRRSLVECSSCSLDPDCQAPKKTKRPIFHIPNLLKPEVFQCFCMIALCEEKTNFLSCYSMKISPWKCCLFTIFIVSIKAAWIFCKETTKLLQNFHFWMDLSFYN